MRNTPCIRLFASGGLRWPGAVARCASVFFVVLAACAEPAPDEKGAALADGVSGADADDITAGSDTAFGVDAQVSIDTTPGKDTLVVPDTATDGDSTANACPGGPGCSCKSTTDCASGFCIDTPTGQQCAKQCPDGLCPKDFKCSTVPLTGGDVTNICVPSFGSLCNPCSASSQCQGPGNGGARCVSFGNAGGFCGVSCNANADCPDTYECGETKDLAGNSSKQCVVKGGGACTCSAGAMQNELYTVCSKETGTAKCAGKRFCLAAGKPEAPAGGGLTACLADVPEAEKCDGKDNDCDGLTDESACDDGSPCTDDNCDPKAGCSATNNEGLCDADGSVCTKDDKCANGKCLSGKVLNCDDNNPCTNDECDSKTGCKNTNAEGLGCNFDDNPCTVGDACKEGKCIAGATKACATEEACVEGKCNLFKGGVCEYKDKGGQACDDGNPCTSFDTCNADSCLGKTTDCDDKTACTIDACDKKSGCSHTAAAGGCDDGDKCTTKDTCANSKCDGEVLDASKYCNDNNGCTSDTCNPAVGCVNKAQNGLQCDDGNACSVGDKCDIAGQCISGANTCACDNDGDCAKKDDGNFCNGSLYCDKTTALSQCKIKLSSVVVCDTATDNACKKTSCDPSNGKCAPQLQPDGLPCPADDSVCTTDDGCKGGACVPGKALNCDDKNACTDDACDAKTGCSHAQKTGPCDADGDACTVDDSCKAGKCEAGAKKPCNDTEACTADSCDATTGNCEFKPLQQLCSDGNECTVGDVCGVDSKSNKYTCLAGKGPNCDDGNPCTNDTCDGKSGCKSAIDAGIQVICYSGDPKTAGKGICKQGFQQCDAAGKLSSCTGDVLPEKGDPCDGKDNDCNGVADPGCSPTNWGLRFANADIAGKGPNLAVRAVVGASSTGGKSADSKMTVNWGFLNWLKGWLAL